MAGLRELKKHLKSVNMTGQLAGAMKTVSAAKFSRVNSVLSGYSEYAKSCENLMKEFGKNLSTALFSPNPDAPECFVVIASNRGLCGGYNAELLAFADEVLEKSKDEHIIVTCGKMTSAHFSEKKTGFESEFVFPDVPSYEDCAQFCDVLTDMFKAGRISALVVIYQKFENMLRQTPTVKKILPFETCGEADEKNKDDDGMLYVPDKKAVVREIAQSFVRTILYSTVLEAAAGAQAATLMAMRSAYDSALSTAVDLETVISRKRQGEVTAGVIETSSDNNQ